MKRTLLIPGILAISTTIGIFQWFRLHHVRQEIERLQIGLSTSGHGANGKSTTSRPDSPFTELQNLLRSKDHSQAGGSRKTVRLMQLAGQLSPTELKAALLEIGKDPESGAQMAFTILSEYLQVHPREAIELALELPDLIEQDKKRGGVDSLFYAWCNNEPANALEWLRSNESRISSAIRDGMFLNAYAHQAVNAPREALSNIVGDAHLANRESGYEVGSCLVEPQKVKALFRGMDEMASDPAEAAALARVREGVVTGLSGLFEYQSIEDSIPVLDECLTAGEKVAFAAYCNEHRTIPDSTKWADWLMGFEPVPSVPHPLIARVQSWANDDPNSAATWVSGMPESALRDDAIAAYAEGVARRDPARAAQWASQFPADQRRDQLIEKIATALEKENPAAAQTLRQTHPSSH